MTNRIGSSVSQSKPLGIILTAVYLAIVNGLLLLIFSILSFFKPIIGLPGLDSLLTFVMLTLGVLSVAACYGLWVLVEWGRKLAIIICAISMLSKYLLLQLPHLKVGVSILVILSGVIDLLIMLYWLRSDHKSIFCE